MSIDPLLYNKQYAFTKIMSIIFTYNSVNVVISREHWIFDHYIIDLKATHSILV